MANRPLPARSWRNLARGFGFHRRGHRLPDTSPPAIVTEEGIILVTENLDTLILES